MDLNKLTTGEKLIAGGGLALFIASFLPWFGLSERGLGSVSWNGWDAGFFWGGLPALIGLALAVVVALPLFMADFKLPDVQGVTWGQIFLGAAGLAALLVVIKLLIGESYFGVSIGRKWGLFVAVVAAGALAAGGFLKFQEEQKGASSSTPPSAF